MNNTNQEPVVLNAGIHTHCEIISKKTWRGQPIGAIRYKGELLSVWKFGREWILIRCIRKLN